MISIVLHEQVLIERIEGVFSRLPKIADIALYPNGYEAESRSDSTNHLLHRFSGKDRFEIAKECEWVDSEVLLRMSAYARWYFAPTFMIQIINGIDRLDFDDSSRLFAFSSIVLEECGISYLSDVSDFSETELDELSRKVPIHERVICESMGLVDSWRGGCYPSMNISWFAASASWFCPVERRVVSDFLHWLQTKWPEDLGVAIALRAFWMR
ncbi:hypothetical protein [Roseateles sp.]|uniref:hypothetical protein n=1 Tax=Roseateles sp. TaxID=1971397 RepID=UPI003262F9E5